MLLAVCRVRAAALTSSVLAMAAAGQVQLSLVSSGAPILVDEVSAHGSSRPWFTVYYIILECPESLHKRPSSLRIIPSPGSQQIVLSDFESYHSKMPFNAFLEVHTNHQIYIGLRISVYNLSRLINRIFFVFH